MKSFWQRGLNGAPRRGMLQALWGPDYRNEFAYLRTIIYRLRKRLNGKNQFSGHYMFQNYNLTTLPAVTLFRSSEPYRNQNVSVQHVHTFSSTLLNEFRFGHHTGVRRANSPRKNTNFEACGFRKFRVGEDGYPKSDLPWNSITRAARLHVPSRRGRGSTLRRSIRFTLVPVAHGNRLQKFQAARRSYR